MSAAEGSALGELPLPKTVEELKTQAVAVRRCSSCRQRQATHSVSVTLGELGDGGGTVFRITKVPVCEACGAQSVALAKRALKA